MGTNVADDVILSTDDSTKFMGIVFGDATSVKCVAFDGGAYNPLASVSFAADSTWHLVTCLYNETGLFAIKDNTAIVASDTSSTQAAVVNSSLPISAGARHVGGSRRFSASMAIDEFRIYNRTLSSAEINFTFQQGLLAINHIVGVSEPNPDIWKQH